jgi:hypothetical protein
MGKEPPMKEWLERELEKVRQTYLIKATNMTGPYQRELGLKKEYNGRQFLELLQNADDEAEGAEDPAILIRLEENRLIVANNGNPFSTGGIRSLIDSDNSPKITSRRKIGYKGLGFRAVLNWSDSIWIKSGGFSIEFSRKNAIRFFRRILEDKPALADEITEHFGENYRYDEICPIATLAVPAWKDSWDLDASKYDTYVVMNFASDEVKKDIQEQICGLSMEVALFLNNVRRIVLQSPERTETIERAPCGAHDLEEIRLVNDNGETVTSRRWRIFSKSDKLPDELRDERKAEQYEYDIRIAVSDTMDDSVNRLFSYFKTEVKFPFPAIVHGTFELDESRKHLVKSAANTFLLKKLASLMVESARKLTRANEEVSWDAMKLLARRGEFDDAVEEMGFYQHLLAAMRSQKLIPVLSNAYMSADEKPVFYAEPFAQVLRGAPGVFADLALHIDDARVRDLVRELKIGTYDTTLFIEKINEASPQLPMDDRADLILLIVRTYGSYFQGVKPEDMPSLLVDGKGRQIGSKNDTFLPPERARFKLPDNVKMHFVSDELFELLKTKAGARTGRELAQKISCFNLNEYRFDTVIRKIVRVTRDLIDQNGIGAEENIRDMLVSLFGIHNDPEAAVQFPANVNVPVPSRSGSLKNAQELYFGKEYPNGGIMEALYSRIDDTLFVRDREALGLGDKTEHEVVEFLKWIGVEEYLRITQKNLRQEAFIPEYEEHVLRNLQYPYTTDRHEVFNSFEDLRVAKGWRSAITVANINDLDDILENARFEDILAWLHSDPRVKQIIEHGHEPADSSFGIGISSKQNYRYVDTRHISSFIVWKLKTTEWIRTKSGKKVKPEVCCLSGTLRDMSPLIEVPDYDMRDRVFRDNNIGQVNIEYILENVGVARDFGKLSDATIYAILRDLESVDPEGKKAKALYRQIIESKPKEWDATIRDSEVRNRFVEEGTLLAEQDGRLKYAPVKSVYYVENITFCKQIIHRFLVAQIDKRSGKDRVRDIFGIEPLEDIHFKLQGPPKFHPQNPAFSRAFNSFKPYVLVLRLQKPSMRTELNSLKRLNVVLCTEIPARYQFGETEEELFLHPYEHIYVMEENTVYLLLKAGRHRGISDLQNDIDFCEALAEILAGILKVGENRQMYRELFPKDREQRDRIISNDLDDPGLEKLKRAKELFSGLSGPELDFWESVLRTKGKTVPLGDLGESAHIIDAITGELRLNRTLVADVYDSLYYENYNSGTNLRFFKILFDALDISVEEFNRNSFVQIDFGDYLRKEFENEKARLARKFKSLVFTALNNAGISEKERFLEFLRVFNDSSPEKPDDINESLVLNVAQCFDRLLTKDPLVSLGITHDRLIQHQDCDPDAGFAGRKETFKRNVAETGGSYAGDIEAFLDTPENRSLLYFGEFDELVKRFDGEYARPSKEHPSGEGTPARKKQSISVNGVDIEYEEDDYQALASSVDEDLKTNDYEIESHEPSKPEAKETEPQTHGGGGSGGIGRAKKQTKEIGFLGEKYVYELLVRRYTKDKVVWASQYARMANVNPEGSDDIGYDMRYSDEKGEWHYVEIKASKDDELAFTISRAEVRFGEEKSSSYEIVLVLNVCSKERRLITLGNVFDYREDESFSNNSKFTVETDDFRIRFK